MVKSRQRGVTMIGWLFLLTPMAIVAYAAIRITPIYLNYMKVSKAIDQVANEVDDGATKSMIETALEKRLDVEGVSFPELKDFLVKRDNSVWTIQANYEDVAPLFANLSLLLQFNKVAEVK